MNREEYAGGMWDVDRPGILRAPHGVHRSAREVTDIRAAATDKVVMPNHYARHSVEPIRFAVENYGPGFLIGNIVKYVTRYDAKDGHKDLAKAARYVEMLRRYEMGDPDWYKAEHAEEPLPSDPSTPLRTLGDKAPGNG